MNLLTTFALLSSSLFVAGVAAAQAEEPGPKGDVPFKQRCAMCHAIGGKGGKLGPDLKGVVGRKAGSAAFSYSPAMKSSKMVWSPATLEKYLAAPTRIVPGTRMVIAISKPEDRRAIIEHLATAK